MPPPPPVLMDELIEEILLLLSPANPASLVRAGLVCRSWRRIVSDPRFCRRFREFHRKPPLLGIFLNSKADDDQTGADVARFVPMISTCPPLADRRNSRALDARHGRVLLHDTLVTPFGFLRVWDPITGGQQKLPLPAEHHAYRRCAAWNAAVVCAAAVSGGCDHLDCRHGPFLIVLSCILGNAAYFFLYSSNTGSWSKPSKIYLDQYTAGGRRDAIGASLLIGDTLHFPVGHEILTYDLAGNKPSLINSRFFGVRNMALVATEDGGLGVAVHRRPGGSDRLWWHLQDRAAWKQGGYVGRAPGTTLVAFAEGPGAAFVSEKGAISMLELKTRRITEVCERGLHCYGIVPYVSFCLPVPGSSKTSFTSA